MLHKVAVGYLIELHGTLFDILPLIFERITFEGKEYTATQLKKIAESKDEDEPLYQTVVEITDLNEFVGMFESKDMYTLYPDIACHTITFEMVDRTATHNARKKLKAESKSKDKDVRRKAMRELKSFEPITQPYTSTVWGHKDDSNIRIGNPTTCGYMIYIAETGDESTQDEVNGVGEKTLRRLTKWKKNLVREGRMKDVLFKAVPNCCS